MQAKYVECPKCGENVRYDTCLGSKDCVKCEMYEHDIRHYCPRCDAFIGNELEKLKNNPLLKLRLTDKISPQKLDFKSNIQAFIDNFTSNLIKQVNQMLALSVIGQIDIGEFQSRFVLTGNTGGDIVLKNDKAVYASIV